MLAVIFVNEYLRRVRTRAFLLTTLLVPAVAIIAIGVVALLISQSVRSESERARALGIAVHDASGRVFPRLVAAAADEEEGYRVTAATGTLAAAKAAVRAGRHHALLVVPAGVAEDPRPRAIELFVKAKQSIIAENDVRGFVLPVVRELRLARLDVSPEAYAALREPLAFIVRGLAEEGEVDAGAATRSSASAATAIAMIIFMVATIYGGAVMQAVMEEKSNRMAEIVVSSATPFALLLGKILAVSAMAATQLGIWLLLVLIGVAVALAAGDWGASAAAGAPLLDQEVRESLPGRLPAMRWDVAAVALVMLPLGYLINASIFAALGAMHENPWEAQMSVTIAMLPMLLAVVVAQTIVFAPDGPLVVICAFLPLTAPAILPARMLLVDMPAWQVVLGVGLCVACTAGLIWLCGRIFRGSLLIYGKKLTWRDLRHVIIAD